MDVGLAVLGVLEKDVVMMSIDDMQIAFKQLLRKVDAEEVMLRALCLYQLRHEQLQNASKFTLDDVNILEVWLSNCLLIKITKDIEGYVSQ